MGGPDLSATTIEILVQITEHQRATLVGQYGDIRSRIEALIQEAVEQYELEQSIEALLPEVIRSTAEANAAIDDAVVYCKAPNQHIAEMELRYSKRRSRGCT